MICRAFSSDGILLSFILISEYNGFDRAYVG